MFSVYVIDPPICITDTDPLVHCNNSKELMRIIIVKHVACILTCTVGIGQPVAWQVKLKASPSVTVILGSLEGVIASSGSATNTRFNNNNK